MLNTKCSALTPRSIRSRAACFEPTAGSDALRRLTVSPGSALPSRISPCAEEGIAAQQNLHAAQRAALHSAASCALGSLRGTAYGFSILFDPLSILSAAGRAELRSLRCSSSN